MMKLTIDELEMLNPFELGKLLINEIQMNSYDVQFIQDLIAVGCPINFRGAYDWTPLHHAAQSGHLEVLELLLSNGADIHVRNSGGYTPLHYAVNWGDIEVVKFLISIGADIEARNDANQTAWNIAHNSIRKAIPELRPI